MLNVRLRIAAGSAVVALLVAGCGGARRVPLARLAENQDGYVGKLLTTSGRVEEQTNRNGSRYYVLADPEQNLVILVPAARARRYVGRDVSVSGRFAVDPYAGREIRITSVASAR